MGRGEQTRQAILTHALGLASRVGVEGLTIGRLADDLRMSKSGLFAHFRSKEELQIQVLRTAVERFIEMVVRPALAAPRGEPRVRALVQRWFLWEQSSPLPGGCPFNAATFELDDRPGPAREFLVKSQREWLDTLATAARIAVREGHFREDLDCEQFAHDLFGVFFTYAFSSRLMRDPKARTRAETAFEALVRAARAPWPARAPSPAGAAGRRSRRH